MEAAVIREIEASYTPSGHFGGISNGMEERKGRFGSAVFARVP